MGPPGRGPQTCRQTGDQSTVTTCHSLGIVIMAQLKHLAGPSATGTLGYGSANDIGASKMDRTLGIIKRAAYMPGSVVPRSPTGLLAFLVIVLSSRKSRIYRCRLRQCEIVLEAFVSKQIYDVAYTRFYVITKITRIGESFKVIESKWHHSLGSTLIDWSPIGLFLVEIRGAGPCRGGAHTLRGCVRWRPI